MPVFELRRRRLQTYVVPILGLAVAVTVGCKRNSAPVPTETSQPVTGGTTSTFATKLQPLQGKTAKVAFDGPDLSGIELRIPLGATQPAPVLVVVGASRVALGASCDTWQRSTVGRFILCQAEPELNGTAQARADAVAVTLRAGLRATKRRFGAYVSSANMGLVGMATSTDITVELVRQSPAFFTRIALVENGFSNWTAVDTARFSRTDSARALLVCGAKHCESEAERVFATMRASGVPVKLLADHRGGPSNSASTKQFPADYSEELAWLLDSPAAP